MRGEGEPGDGGERGDSNPMIGPDRVPRCELANSLAKRSESLAIIGAAWRRPILRRRRTVDDEFTQ